MAKIKGNCTIYLVRHGETDWNLNHKIQGQTDSVLNKTGKLQAKEAAKKLKEKKFDAVFSSDLLRAKETAEIIALEKKLAVETTKVLRERRFGKLEGKSTEQLIALDQLKNALSKEEKLKYRYNKLSENDEELILRIITFLREVAVGYLGKNVLIVTHGGVMRVILDHLGEGNSLYVTNGSFVKIESDGVDFYIKQTEGILSRKFRDKKVLIFGLGLNGGGVGSAKFFASQGARVKVTDLKSAEILKPSLNQLKDFPQIEYTLGEHKKEDIDWAELIIKNPAVKPGNEYIEYAKSQGKIIEQDMGIFLEYVKCSQIIGVTGTKGKSTTASLIYEVLKTLQPDSMILAGNIGTSVLDIIPQIKPDTLVVLEISSFQLEAFDTHQVSPKWAVITNITPDHLNYYQTMDEYIAAKKIIGKYQTENDFLFIRENDLIIDKSQFLKGLKGKIIRYSTDLLPLHFKTYLKGEHNLENMAASFRVAKMFGIDEQKILITISQFKGIPYRMELVAVWHEVKIINDTTSTGPDSGIKALKTFPNCILICGGMNKKMSYDEYIKTLNKYAKKVFFLEGDSTDTILLSLRAERSNLPIKGPYNNLEKLLTDVKQIIRPGDIILFSPAATSFNLYQNEFDRGRKFNEAVQKVFSDA